MSTLYTNKIEGNTTDYILMPKQICFYAKHSGTPSTVTSSAVKVEWGVASPNVGSHFTNHKFTAPVTGNYWISSQLTTMVASNVNATAGYVALRLYKNGSVLQSSHSLVADPHTVNNYNQVSTSRAIALNANDYLEVYVQSDATGTVNLVGDHSYFSGFLIG